MSGHAGQTPPARLAASMTWSFPNRTPAEGYALARRLGFSGIEHSFPYATPETEIAALLRDNGLDLTFVYTPCRVDSAEKGFACQPGREDEFKRSVEAAMRYAEAGGAEFIGVLAGSVPEGIERARCIDTLLANLNYVADALKHTGKRILIEPLCARSAPAFAIQTLDEGAEVLQKLARDEVCLCFDTLHVALERGSLIEHLDQHWNAIAYIQLANTPGRNGIGEGELDLVWFLRAALARGWRGWVSCEYTPLGAYEDMLAWAAPFRREGLLEPRRADAPADPSLL